MALDDPTLFFISSILDFKILKSVNKQGGYSYGLKTASVLGQPLFDLLAKNSLGNPT